MEEELKQEDWEVQTTFNEEDIDLIEEGGDIDESTNNDTREGE